MDYNKIAIFYSGYLPGEKYGGPVTSLYNFTQLLGDDISIFIICLDHDLKDKERYKGIKDGWNKVGKANVIYLSDNNFNRTRFSEVIDEINPELLYVSSIFSVSHVLPILSLSKKKHIPVLLAPRGELNSNALKKNSIKKKLYLSMLKISNKFKETRFQATSNDELKNIIDNLHVNESRVYLLPNIPSPHVPKKALTKKAKEIRLCFVGRIVKNKNLYIALEAVRMCRFNVYFDIYGPIEDNLYWDECKSLLESENKENIHINYLGALKPSIMRETYSQYDCLISPTEFENYGQSIVEAMLHDVPVIISKGTTPWDNIEDNNAGFVIPLSHTKQFSQAIDTIAEMDCNEYAELINRLRIFTNKNFDFDNLRNQYLNVISQIIN